MWTTVGRKSSGEVQQLTEGSIYRIESLEQLEKPGDGALRPYRQLQKLVIDLGPLQEAAEGAAPHLLNHINGAVTSLQQTIEVAYSKNLEGTLAKMNWPKTTAAAVPLALLDEWTTNIGRLLDLQRSNLESRKSGSDPLVLLPCKVLVEPLEQRFAYHFSGNKPTNRLDKPEYFLSHVSDLIREYSPFLQDHLQPIILRHFRGADDLFVIPAYVDATVAFITALMPMLERKLRSVAGQLESKPALLSHLIQEVIAFDTTLQETYAYTPTSLDTPWRGLSHFLLTDCGHFTRWLSAEKDFALQRYMAIVASSDAGDLDYDAVSADLPKPTASALRVNDLLETITARYRPLASFRQKLRFLLEIQIEIFDLYHRRLADALQAYLTATSGLARTLQTTLAKEDPAADLQGVRGLDRLARVFGSADYLERAMRDWSDDVFFLEMWVELDRRSREGGGAQNNAQAAKKHLRVLSQDRSTGPDEIPDVITNGALFDETAASYERLRRRSEHVITEAVTSQLNSALRPYAARSGGGVWAALAATATGSGSSSTADLDPAIRLLDTYLGFLRRATGAAATRRIAREVCRTVQAVLWSSVLLSGPAGANAAGTGFSTAGIAQFSVDLQALETVIARWAGPAVVERGLRKVHEAVRLVGLPVRSESQKAPSSRTSADDADAAWDEDGGAWDEGADEPVADPAEANASGPAETDIAGMPTSTSGSSRKQPSSSSLSLFQVERMVFQDNAGARKALELLGLETLTESEARELLRRRVELGS